MASTIAIFWRPTTPTATAGGVLHGDGTGYKITAVGTSGYPLLSAGASDPSFGQLDPTVGILNGATGTGAVVLQNSPTLTGSPLTPTPASTDNSTKIASTAYVTTAVANAIAAVNPAVAVQAATAAILPNTPTYLNGVAGIGATITAGVTNTTLVVDGYTPLLNDRILVKNESGGGGLGASRNGIYTVTQLAAPGLAWVLTRALDYDQPSDMNNTGAIPVVNGTANTQTQWVLTSTVNTVGTDTVTFTQFSSNPSKVFTIAGSNLSGTGTNTVAYAPTVITDASTGTQNNYAPGISGNTVHFWAGANILTVNGFVGGVSGAIYTFRNTGSFVAFFNHNSGSGSAGNKIFNAATALATPVAPGGSASWVYDGTQWQLMNHIQGAPVSYTVTWTGFVSNPVIGNGTLTGSYVLKSTELLVTINITMGGTTTFGSGFWEVSVPVAPSGNTTVGSGLAVDIDGLNVPLATSFTLVGASGIFATDTALFNNIDATHPFTWASTDILRVNLAYFVG